MDEGFTVLEVGTAWVTDLGRAATGRGLSRHGALDQYACQQANALVGNHLGDPIIENTLTALELRATGDLLAAVTGAAADVLLNGAPVAHAMPVSVRDGDVLRLGPARTGVRSYLALRGAFHVARYRGSCAPDPMIGFGRALVVGDEVEATTCTRPLVHPLFGTPVIRLGAAERPSRTVPVTDGPDVGRFGTSLARVFESTYAVTPRSNAMGMRIRGPVPHREDDGEILSTGVPPGAIEVPGGDELIVLHRSCGITAGYAIPLVVTMTGLDQLAQVRPGQSIRFRHLSVEEAVRLYRQRQVGLLSLRRRAEQVLAAHGVREERPTGIIVATSRTS